MTEQLSGPVASLQLKRNLALTALITGALGWVLTFAFFFADSGMTPLVLGFMLGVVGIIFGIVALKKRQSKAVAIAGLVLGALAAMVTVGIVGFALLFIGAFVASFG